MTASSFRWRLGWAAALGLAGIAACGAVATPEGAPRIGEAGTGPVEPEPVAADAAAAVPDAGGGDGAARCPFGPVEDPHHGFVRCRTAEEADAGWQPPSQGPGDAAAAPDAEPAPDAGAPAAQGPAPLVEIGTPSFENGEVKTIEKSLTGLAKEIGRCVGDHGGLSGKTGSLKMQFLVRARERAEGVEVLAQKGVTAEAGACVRTLLKNRWVGAPSADPVGVTVTFTFKPSAR